MWKHKEMGDNPVRAERGFRGPTAREERREYLQNRIEEALKSLKIATAQISDVEGEQALRMRDENLFLWICSMMKIAGTGLDRSDVAHLMNKDEINVQIDYEVYRFLKACKTLYTEFLHMIDFDFYLNERYIIYMNETLTGQIFNGYRAKNVPLRTTGYSTPRVDNVKALMEDFALEIMNEFHGENEITNAIYAHDRIMQIWPFQSRNAETAYAVMSFLLLKAGYPLPALDIDEGEHMRLIAEKELSESEAEFLLLVVESLLEQSCIG